MRVRFAMTVAVAVMSVVLAGAALAAPNWKGAGWYVVADTIYGPMLDDGPYATKEECTPHLSPSEPEADYACEYLDAQPKWDE